MKIRERGLSASSASPSSKQAEGERPGAPVAGAQRQPLRHGAAASNQAARCRACGSHLSPPPLLSLSNFSIRSLRLPAGLSVFFFFLLLSSGCAVVCGGSDWRGEAIAFLEPGSGGVVVIVRVNLLLLSPALLRPYGRPSFDWFLGPVRGFAGRLGLFAVPP